MTLVNVQSVERASRLLKLLAANREYMHLADLAGSAGLAKSTAYGLLQTLVRERLVEHDPRTRRYRIARGLKFPPQVVQELHGG